MIGLQITPNFAQSIANTDGAAVTETLRILIRLTVAYGVQQR